MGSGCTNSKSSSSCFQTTTDNCIQYTGEPIPLLGICTSDLLSEVEESIITKLLTVMDGTGVELSDLTFDCDFVANQMLGKDKTLDLILQMLVNSACTLKDLIDDVSTQVNLPVTYDPGCLGVGTYTTQSLLQAAVNELCTLKTAVANLTSQISTEPLPTVINNYAGNLLLSNITSLQRDGAHDYGISKSGTQANASLTFYGFLPPFFPVWGYAPLSWFDSSGRGLSTTPVAGYYICNGLNNTFDMRGFTAAGATNLPGINGNNLKYEVDPIAQNDPTIATNILDRKGIPKVGLGVNNLPPHNHTATDSGHTHNTPPMQNNYQSQGGTTAQTWVSTDGTPLPTSVSYANITVGSTGGNVPHENRQPTAYGYWIVRTF